MGASPMLLTRDLGGTDLQRLFIDPNMYLAPQAAFGTAVLAGVPLALGTFEAHAL